jgi:GT2 family glycosyltransferase
MNIHAQAADNRRPAPQAVAPIGVSVVICSYNGAPRLPRALEHLARQDAPADLRWEVIVVDNASTDDTGETARRCWAASHAAQLRVVSEPQLGLSFAKQRGIAEARYEFVGFVDDDSWVCPGWVRTALEVCLQHPEAGAVAGIIEAAFETRPPRWFEHYQGWFGVWTGVSEPCDVSDAAGGLCGDGMVLRKSAWEELLRSGFRMHWTGNRGDAFNGGEDEEISVALRLAGWRLWCDPRLRLKQFLPAAKLDWRLLRLRARDAGSGSIDLHPYYLALRQQQESGGAPFHALLDKVPPQWLWRALWGLKDLLRRPATLLLMPFFPLEGCEPVLAAESALGRIKRLVKLRGAYDSMLRQVRRRRKDKSAVSGLALDLAQKRE